MSGLTSQTRCKDVTRRLAICSREFYGFKVDIKVDLTVEEMDDVIAHYTEKISYAPKDQLLVFFAGHGHYKPGKGGFIVAKNSELDGSLRSYLKFTDIRDYFNETYSVTTSCSYLMYVLEDRHLTKLR